MHRAVAPYVLAFMRTVRWLIILQHEKQKLSTQCAFHNVYFATTGGNATRGGHTITLIHYGEKLKWSEQKAVEENFPEKTQPLLKML